MKSLIAVAFALLIPSVAFAQEDDRVKRIVDRIEKEIRDSHERTREDLRAIIRNEIQKSQGKTAPAPAVPSAPAGKVFLGITADDLTAADREALGSRSGVKVADVRGPAKDAGIKQGDLLLELDGEKVNEDKLGEILARHKPGDSLDASLLRSGKRVSVKIVLAERKD
jgi:S1-C subfamily serine protease